MKEKTLDIGEVAKLSGFSAATLRYYEQRGLIKAVARKGLRRQYDGAVLEKLTLISLGRLANLSLDEIADMFGEKSQLEINRAKLRLKAQEVDEQITRLKATRDSLLHVAECPAEHHLQCPKFQKLMRVANKLK